jgi:hypothetical protein
LAGKGETVSLTLRQFAKSPVFTGLFCAREKRSDAFGMQQKKKPTEGIRGLFREYPSMQRQQGNRR